MRKDIYLAVSLFIIYIGCAEQNQYEKEKLSGPYLGQTPPADSAVLFAPGIISTPLYDRDIAMTPDGKEIYFSVSAFGYNLIYYTEEKEDGWTDPKPAEFIEDFDYMYYEPHVNFEGDKLFFLSTLPDADGVENDQDIWFVERSGDAWGEPKNLGEPVNTAGGEYFPSLTKTGTLYFTRQPKGERANYIFRSKLVDGQYNEVEKLGENVNCGAARFNAYIARDESYMIIPAVGMPDSYGGTDYYISFRNENDEWSSPLNMDSEINSAGTREYSAFVSPDGKYIFFMAVRQNDQIDFNSSVPNYEQLLNSFNTPLNGNSNIYWISSNIIEELREKAVGGE